MNWFSVWIWKKIDEISLTLTGSFVTSAICEELIKIIIGGTIPLVIKEAVVYFKKRNARRKNIDYKG